MKNLEEEKVLIGRPEMTLEMMMTWLKHPTNAQTSERRWGLVGGPTGRISQNLGN